MVSLDDLKVIVSTMGIITDGEKFLMSRRGEQKVHLPGVIEFPSGKVEESVPTKLNILEVTLRRELMEEVCLEVGRLIYVESKLVTLDDGTPVVNVLFLCEHLGGEPAIGNTREIAEIMWLTAEEILNRDEIPDWAKAYLRHALVVLETVPFG